VRNLHSSIYQSDLINSLDIWGKASMDTENFTFDDSSNTEVIKDLSAVFPGISISVLSDGFVIESINSSNLSSLVVAS